MFCLRNHPSLTLASDMQAIASPLLQKYNLSYFQYLTVFLDGSFSIATNHARWLEFVFPYMAANAKPAVYSHIKQEQLNKNTYYFLWEPNLPREPVQLARQFDIANGLTLVERFDDHYNMIGFGTPVSNQQAIDTYLNHLPEFLQFVQNFKHDQKSLIKTINDAKFTVPKPLQDQNLDKMLYKAKHKAIPIVFQGITQHVTQQEYACIKGLANGSTCKEIAKSLDISPRTVESYMNRVKNRFGLRNKRELLQLILSL